MKADSATQRRLLDVQSVDTAIARLQHRRASAPEIAEIARCDEQQAALHDEVVRADTDLGDLDREQRRLESDVDQVRQRAERDRDRMQAGNVGSPKELERLQHEVDSLARRQSELEDQVLEFMERRESAEMKVSELRDRLGKIRSDRDSAVASRDKVFAEIDADLAARAEERASIVSELPTDLVELYERIRQNSGGFGAAALRKRHCEGCRIELAGTELAEVMRAPADEVIRCENCRRILVRVSESGL